jgi:copper(I)-binding protein
MVSRQTTRPLRKLVPAVAFGVSALLGIVGCSAGQVAQTAEMEPAVNGNTGQVGTIALRDVQVAFPESGEPYKEGEDAPLLLSIVNTGGEDDELVGVTTPAGQVELIGNPAIPAGTSLQIVLPDENTSASATTTSTSTSETSETSEAPESEGSEAPGTETSETSGSSETSATTTGSPADTEAVAPPVVGTMSLVITGLTADLPFGKNVPVTFEFANAGTITIQLPIGAPSTPRPEAEAVEGEH